MKKAFRVAVSRERATSPVRSFVVRASFEDAVDLGRFADVSEGRKRFVEFDDLVRAALFEGS